MRGKFAEIGVYSKWIIPVLFVLFGFITGIIFEIFVLKKLKALAIKTRLPGNEIIFLSLKGIPKIPHNVIVVPNSKLASAIFTNYHLPAKEITLTVGVGVSYDSDLEKVERVTIEVAREVMQEIAGDITDFAPFVLYEEEEGIKIPFPIREIYTKEKRQGLDE